MTIFYKAILPKRDPAPKINIQRAISLMRQFRDDALKELKVYPPKPPDSRYIRTTNLRKGWRKFGPKMQNGNIEMDIFHEHEKVDYMVWVQGRTRAAGPKQLSRFRKQGWFSVSDVNMQIWPKYRRRIARSLGVSERYITRTFHDF